jgi:hypothetical protein
LGSHAINSLNYLITTQAVLQSLGFSCEIDKITDPAEVEKYGLPLTPILIVDGKVRSMGRVLSQQALTALLKFIAAHSSQLSGLDD